MAYQPHGASVGPGESGDRSPLDLNHLVDHAEDRPLPVSRADIRMIRRAVRKGWDVDEGLRSDLPAICGAMAKGLRMDPITKTPIKVSERGVVAAIQTLKDMVHHNDNLPPGSDGDIIDGTVEHDFSKLTVEEMRLLEKALTREANHDGTIHSESSEAPSSAGGQP